MSRVALADFFQDSLVDQVALEHGMKLLPIWCHLAGESLVPAEFPLALAKLIHGLSYEKKLHSVYLNLTGPAHRTWRPLAAQLLGFSPVKTDLARYAVKYAQAMGTVIQYLDKPQLEPGATLLVGQLHLLELEVAPLRGWSPSVLLARWRRYRDSRANHQELLLTVAYVERYFADRAKRNKIIWRAQ